MSKAKRGGTHTTLTGAAKTVVHEIDRLPSGLVKFISPGHIVDPNRSGARIVTFIKTNVGCELLIAGDGVMKVTVHTERPREFRSQLAAAKKLRGFTLKYRERKPG